MSRGTGASARAASGISSRRNATVDTGALLRLAREKLATDGTLRLAALGPKAARPHVAAQLQAEGFELTRTAVRRPIVDQLRSALDAGAFIPLKSLSAHVRGATAAEARRAALDLVARGEARRILRTKVDTLAPASAPVLAKQELSALKSVLDALSKNIAAAMRQKPPSTLLKADVAAALEGALGSASPAPRGALPKDPPSGRAGATAAPLVSMSVAVPATEATATRHPVQDGELLRTLEATEDPSVGLSFVPEVVRTLSADHGVEAARAAVVAAARRGLIELRPEGGLSRLSPEEMDMCPAGPQGTRLSWARRLETSAHASEESQP